MSRMTNLETCIEWASREDMVKLLQKLNRGSMVPERDTRSGNYLQQVIVYGRYTDPCVTTHHALEKIFFIYCTGVEFFRLLVLNWVSWVNKVIQLPSITELHQKDYILQWSRLKPGPEEREFLLWTVFSSDYSLSVPLFVFGQIILSSGVYHMERSGR